MYRKKMNTYKEKMMNFGWFLRMFITGPTRTVSSIYTESYIPDNHYSVVLGKIQKTKSGEFFMKRPEAIAPTKEVMIGQYMHKMGNNWIVFYCLSALCLITVAFIVKYSLKNPMIRNLFKKNSNIELFDRLSKIFVRTKTCKNCQEKVSSNLRVPCGHLNLCAECEEK